MIGQTVHLLVYKDILDASLNLLIGLCHGDDDESIGLDTPILPGDLGEDVLSGRNKKTDNNTPALANTPDGNKGANSIYFMTIKIDPVLISHIDEMDFPDVKSIAEQVPSFI